LVENQLAVGGPWFAAGSIREGHAGRKQKNRTLASFFFGGNKGTGNERFTYCFIGQVALSLIHK
jgi:hypothetical protein